MDAEIRRHFAEEIELVANISTPGLAEAFAAVRRENFLPPGPWQVLTVAGTGRGGYRTTRDADVRHVYHNVAIAIDPARQLNNGQPSGNAMWIDALRLKARERVAHIGCGAGYFSAIIATVVGPEGHVTAYEVDRELAARAAQTLAAWPNVKVIAGSGAANLPRDFDAIYFNAGVSHIAPEWLDALADGGRLVAPLTFAPPSSPIGSGISFVIARSGGAYSARPIGPVAIFNCTDARDDAANQAVAAALRANAWLDVAELRRERHERDDRCRIHSSLSCLAAAATPA
jgi:protein-L-isoaspartate(D-aspartate) O-methyltransferase